MSTKTVVIIGAGPAGLTAARELSADPGVKIVLVEACERVGGLSATVVHNGLRMDIGGHRFFSRSEKVLAWWRSILPVQGPPSEPLDPHLPYDPGGPDPHTTDRVMLVRRRVSHILFLGRLFDYPVTMNAATLWNLGPARAVRFGASYMRARLFPRPVNTLEDLFINRFGQRLYRLFFKDYTRKVWGRDPADISPEWGHQRIQGLSVARTLAHAAKKALGGLPFGSDVETSLTEWFYYPKYGPGQLWEEVARQVQEAGGRLLVNHRATGLAMSGNTVTGVTVRDTASGAEQTLPADWVVSTMPVPHLVKALEQAGADVPLPVREAAEGLSFRDFLVVGVLVRRPADTPRDNWIYVQEKGLRLARIQLFSNWSPYLGIDPETLWVGLEYFATTGDDLWERTDSDLTALAVHEMEQTGLARAADVLDSVVVRAPRAYPAYFGGYDRFGLVRNWLDTIPNLFLCGRAGMHRYNNQDHSMLSAMAVAENIRAGRTDKANVWAAGDPHLNGSDF